MIQYAKLIVNILSLKKMESNKELNSPSNQLQVSNKKPLQPDSPLSNEPNQTKDSWKKRQQKKYYLQKQISKNSNPNYGNIKQFDEVDQVHFPEGYAQKIITTVEAKLYPYNCIGLLVGIEQLSKQEIFGTAFLITENTILTVAHNIYNNKKWISNFLFYPGQSDLQQFQNGIPVTKYKFLSEFKDINQLKTDYAVMKLEKTVQRQKYLELGVNYGGNKDEDIYIYGYRKDGCNIKDRQALLKGVKKSRSHIVSQKIALYHQLSTTQGNSGSPIMIKRDENYIVIAIHKGGLRIETTNKEKNQGRLITNDLLDNLRKWQKNLCFRSKIQHINLNQQNLFNPQEEWEEQVYKGIILQKDKKIKELHQKNQKKEKQIMQLINNQNNIAQLMEKLKKLKTITKQKQEQLENATYRIEKMQREENRYKIRIQQLKNEYIKQSFISQ